MIWKVTTGALGFLLGAAVFGPGSISTVPLAAERQEAPTARAQDSEDGITDPVQRRAAQLERLQRQQEHARAERDAKAVGKLRDMQGGWQLVEFNSSVLHDAGRQEVAFMVVSGEFLSIEMHVAYFDLSGAEQRSFIQTGTYRLNFNSAGELTAMLLIGTVKDDDGYTIPQYPGEIKVYQVLLQRGALTLLSSDATRFTFERMATGALTELIYREVDWLPGAEKREARRAAQEAVDRRALGEEPAVPAPIPSPED